MKPFDRPPFDRLRAAVVVAAALLAGCPGRTSAPPGVPQKGPAKARMEIFFMSQCPYSAKLMKILPGVIDRMDGRVEVTLHAVVHPLEGGEFSAMHGPQELFGNVLTMCASESAPSEMAKAEFAACLSSSISSVPFGWEDCAVEAGIALDPIKACTLGDRGQELLAAAWERIQEYGVQGSPYVFVDGVPHNAKLAPDVLHTALCCALDTADRPGSCPDSPSCYNVRVDMTVITDARCEGCSDLVEETVAMFVLPFPLLEVEVLDRADPAGAAIIQKVDADLLPAYLFHTNVKESAAYEVIEEHIYESGGYSVVLAEAVDSTFDPTKEICTNEIDDTSNGLADCEDPDCTEKLPCRAEKPAMLDLFVMSQCPFGVEAMSAVHDVYNHFKGAYGVKLHWISSVYDLDKFEKKGLPEVCTAFGDKAYCSLHGQEETEENLRQICAQSLYPTDKFLSYIKCRTNIEVGLDWGECAAAVDMEAGDIEACATGKQGHDMLAEDARLQDILGVSASPMYLWNNTLLESVKFTPASIAAKACETNTGMERCEDIDVLDDESIPVPPEARCYE